MKNSKERYILNRLSQRILDIGLFVCILGYLGVLRKSYSLFETGYLKSYQISLMLEHITMSAVIVVIFSLILDIHIKRSEK